MANNAVSPRPIASGSTSQAWLIWRIGVSDVDAIEIRSSETSQTTAAASNISKSMPIANEVRQRGGSLPVTNSTVVWWRARKASAPPTKVVKERNSFAASSAHRND